MKLGILIVNRNCLNHTMNIMRCLNNQTSTDFEVHIVDNGSTEAGTDAFLRNIGPKVKSVVKNNENRPLNWIWNDFAKNKQYDYLCFLNNDILAPQNFVSDTIAILDKEPNVDCVIHATNHSKYKTVKKDLEYSILDYNKRVRQGWDFTIRSKNWSDIPLSLKFYCGDDYVFEKIYRDKKLVAVAISSPIIHYQGETRNNSKKGDAEMIKANAMSDISEYKKLGFTHIWTQLSPYSEIKPTYSSFIYE